MERVFLDDLPSSTKASRLRAIGAVEPGMERVEIVFGEGADALRRVVRLSHILIPSGAGRSFFICPNCGRRANRLMLHEKPMCAGCLTSEGARYRSVSGSPAKRAEARRKRIERLRGMLEHGADCAKPEPGRRMRRKRQAEMSLRRALIADLGYTYDFGDGWRHDVAIEAVAEGVPGALYPRLVAGERRGPPEDVGGRHGYFAFLEAALDPSHEDHARMIEWCGGRFDPREADLAMRASRVERLAARRRAGMEGYEKSRKVRAGESR